MAKNKGGEQTNGNTHKKYGIMVIQIMVIQIKKHDFIIQHIKCLFYKNV